MKTYKIDVNINGKITLEVKAENKQQAKEMVKDLLENSSFKQVMNESKSKVSLNLNIQDKLALSR